MGALAHQTALVQHQDLVRMQYGGNALCYDDHGGVAGLSFQRTAQGYIGLEIEGRKTVIEQVDLWLFRNGTGDGKALLLAAGHIGAALCDRAFVALRVLHR